MPNNLIFVPAKCTELPEAPQNGMVVAPKLDHGMVGKFECRDGYMLKGHNTTQCFFGNWTGMTPGCKEGELNVRGIVGQAPTGGSITYG